MKFEYLSLTSIIFICDALHDFVPFAQFKNVKNTLGGGLLLVKLQAKGLLCYRMCTYCMSKMSQQNFQGMNSQQSSMFFLSNK